MADVVLLAGLIACIEHDNNDPPPPDEVQPIALTDVNPHLGDFTLNGLPVSEISSFSLPQSRRNSDLRTLVPQRIEPSDELLGLEDGKHERNVFSWIRFVN